MKHLSKRSLSFLLCCAMCVGMIPTTSLAGESKEPKDPVTVEKAEYNDSNCEIWFNINETAKSDVSVNIGDEVSALLVEHAGYIMPADQYNVKVHIKNNSADTFFYESGGLDLGTKKVSEGTKPLTDFVGYDGNRIGLTRVASIDYNHPAMRELFGGEIEGNYEDFQKVLAMYDTLKDKDYEGTDALSEYFLDYYREKYSNEALTWDDLVKTHKDEIINAFAKSNTEVFFNLTKEQLDEVIDTRFDKFTYVLGKFENSDIYQVQIKWPDARLGAFSYNAFYQDLLTVVFGGEEKPSRNDGMRDRGIGDYSDRTSAAYTKADDYLKTIGEDGKIESGEEATFEMTLTLEGTGTGNMYMSYDFEGLFGLTLRFEKVELPTITIKPIDLVIYAGATEGYGGKLYTTKDAAYQSISDRTVLPTPGYVITLPEEINAQFDGYVDLSQYLSFFYKDNIQEREWSISPYSESNKSMDDGRYIYEINPDKNGKIPVSLSITDEDGTTFVATEFEFKTEKPYTEYKTGIYPGVLDQSRIQAKITKDGKEQICNVKIETGTLSVRGITYDGKTTDLKSGVNGAISFKAETSSKYYLNRMPFEVPSEDVDILVDELSVKDDSLRNATRNIAGIKIPDDALMDFQYIDLVDGSNGDAWVKTTSDLTFTWAYPEGYDENDNFQIIHYGGMDRNYDDVAAAWNTADIKELKIEKTKDGVVFKAGTEGFSPFALVYSKADGGGTTGTSENPDPDLTSESDPSPEDSSDDQPQTGDQNNWAFWIVLCGLSLIGIAVPVLRRRHFI